MYEHAAVEVDGVRGKPGNSGRVNGGVVSEKPREACSNQEHAGTAWLAPYCYQSASNHGPANDKIWQPKDRLVPGEPDDLSADANRYRTKRYEHNDRAAGHNTRSHGFHPGS
jgi:hypothetical protein